MNEIIITKENFETEVIKSDKPVLLDFWAIWCGPCQMLSPIIAEIASDYDGKLKIGKVNVDDQPELADEFSINSIPTLVVFKDGQVTNKSIGYQTRAEIVELLRD